MAWKNFIGPYAITSRRRLIASALIYGLSLTVRFTSATGEDTGHPVQAAQSIGPMLSILMKDGVPISRDWPLQSARAIVFQHARSPASAGCNTSCERPMPMAPMLDCPQP